MRRVALVTGGAVRIGGALSLGLAEAGYDVVVNYHSSGGAAREVVRRVEAMGRRAVAVQADVSRPDEVRGLADDVREVFGRLDLLVNSAATFHATPLLEIEEREWDQVMGVNLKGPFLTVQALAPLLREARGMVLNIVDLGAFEPWTRHPHHAVSKAGLLHLTRIMARVLAPAVRVNAIAPGTVLPPEEMDREARARDEERTPLGAVGSPEDVVRTALFLAGSPFITGEVVVVDGGRGLGKGEG
jgi:pteridine reductase